jgi:hypothetical protein
MADGFAFPSAGNGALSAAKVAENPIMPWWGPVSPQSSIYHYGNIDLTGIAYATDLDKARALVPEELELMALPGFPEHAAVNLVFAKYRENDKTGPYMEAFFAIPVLAQGNPFLYVAAIYVDNDAALTAGREFGGYPKKMADIYLQSFGDLFLGRVSRNDSQRKTADPLFGDFASGSLRRGQKLFDVPLPANEIPQLEAPYNLLFPMPPATGEPQGYILPTIGLRTVPGVGADACKAQVHQLIGTPWLITRAEVWAGLEPSVDLIPSEEDPLSELLPVRQVLAGYVLRGDMQTDPKDWLLLAQR